MPDINTIELAIMLVLAVACSAFVIALSALDEVGKLHLRVKDITKPVKSLEDRNAE